MYSKSKNRFYGWLLPLLIISAIAGLSGVLYHTTHCHEDHGHCHICLLAATLIIAIVAGIAFFMYRSSITGLVNDRFSCGYLGIEVPARSPPYILSLSLV